jgi:hypothetical protein
MECSDCGRNLPITKFNVESGAPTSCFKCRVSTIRLGFTAGKSSFHGDDLVGGTIASDNRHTVAEARANGHEPVPAGYKASGVSAKELSRLKTKVGF